jgi:hypothetical protein
VLRKRKKKEAKKKKKKTAFSNQPSAQPKKEKL